MDETVQRDELPIRGGGYLTDDSSDVRGKLIDKLQDIDNETWYDIYLEGFPDCYWPDSLVQSIIQDKIMENGWELHQQSGGNLGFRATITKWARVECKNTGTCWRPVFEVVREGKSNMEAILRAYLDAVIIERNIR